MNRAISLCLMGFVILMGNATSARAESYLCIIGSQSTWVPGKESDHLIEIRFTVDVISSEINGLQILEFEFLKKPQIHRRPNSTSFWINLSGGASSWNFFAMHPSFGKIERTFILHISVTSLQGKCAEAPANQIKKEATSGFYY